ncbi:MAG: L,D-transpeptidase [Anaerolineales bacterium]|nr:L,D-transpeptidase [Anaerolineales bacterium]
MSKPKISRRDFLKLSGYGMLGLILPELPFRAQDEFDQTQGRVIDNLLWSYEEPNKKSKRKKAYWRDLIVAIANTTVNEDESAYNRVWYQVADGGYVYSGSIQPVRTVLNQPQHIALEGALGEVSVPFTDAHLEPDANSKLLFRLYYETVHWIKASAVHADGTIWYALLDDKTGAYYYAPGKHLRLIADGELAPLSPDVPNAEKLVKVNLTAQLMLAYEAQRLVYATRVSTGGRLGGGRYATPTGEYLTYHKRPTRHMARGDLASNGFDLPGVPWVCYIKEDGTSFHGTYWHNDYGRPRSHGCINMTPQAAKWLYRWTTPRVTPGKEFAYGRVGTRVEIAV